MNPNPWRQRSVAVRNLVAIFLVAATFTGCIARRPANAVDAKDALRQSTRTINESAHDAGQFDNPIYLAWAGCAPGTFTTLAWHETVGTEQGPKDNVHERVTILRRLEFGMAHVEVREKSTFGHETRVPDSLIPAHLTHAPVTAGEQDVAALGRTFHCTVYESPGRRTGTTFYDPQVPGGVVKIVQPFEKDYRHQPATWVLTKIDRLP